MYHVTSWHFHWKFWAPVIIQGQRLFFGWWARLDGPNGPRVQTAEQVRIKRDLGWII